ncbi:uncharacterized protein [Haliotis asinina]|uniref:uncharacterized protein n=1 Tax=Haliotis asinina TaxID=109174 RepID=UPI0035327C4B
MPTADCSRQHDGGVDDTSSKIHVSNRATPPGPAGNRHGLVNGDAGNLPDTQISNKPDYENKGSNENVSKTDLGRMSSSPEATSSPSKSTGRRQVSFEKGDPRKEVGKEEGQADAISKQGNQQKAGDIPDSGSQTVYTLRNEGEIVNISTTDQPGTVGVEDGEDEEEEDESEEDSEEDSEEETASESEAEEDTMDGKHDGVVSGDSGIVLTDDHRQTDSPVLQHDHHPQTDGAASQHEEQQSSANSEASSPQQQSPVRQRREINKDSQDLQNAASAIHVMQDNIQGLLCRAKTILGTYHTELSEKPLKDFVLEKEDFHDNFVSIGKIYSECEHVTSSINKQLKELRQTTNEMCRLINRKFREEDLSSWVDSEGDEAEREFRLREERTAQEKAVLAKAAEARAALANATSGVAETHEIIAQAEADAAEAEATAKKARAHADDAIRTAEEAKRAAEEKRKVEEEARKKAEAKAKIKAEEERKKHEEEEKRLAEEAKKKGTSVDEERQREMAEREAREAERKNPKNWPRYIYSIDGGDFDPGVGCIIRAIQGSMSRDDVEVKRLDQISGVLSLYENEELISNIVHVQPNDKEKSFTFEEPISLAIPHCAPRSGLGREPVIKMLQSNGRWTDLSTNDVHFEDIKELRFVEARLKRFGTFAVIYKIKKDTMTFTKKGGKVTSSVDSRVTFTAKQMCFKQNASFTLEVQSVDISLVSDLRKKRPECSLFLASSPIIKLGSLLKKFQKPLTVTLPVPPNPSRLKRPGTSVNREETTNKTDIRPATAKPGVLFTKKEEETPADGLHLVQYLSDGTWVKVTDVTLVQAKNKDIVTFDINKLYERFSIIRTKLEATNTQVEQMVTILNEAIPQRTIQLFLRQHSENLNEIIISCSNVSRVERSLRKLEDEGFEEGPPLSKEISVKEGQIFNLKFRGNLKPETDDFKHQFVFNSHIPCRVDFAVETVDTFAQKGFDSYRGFAQLFTEGLVPQTLPPADDNNNRESKRGNTQKPQPRVVMVIGEVLISELLMTIPKPEPEPPKRLLTAPLSNASEGPVDHELLFHLARELGDEWKRLAQYLNVRRMRIQAILRQNVNNDNTSKVYDMLTTWSKRLPRAVDRVEILYHALMSVGRGDLAAELRDRKIEFKRQRSFSARDSYLRKAFVKIARDQSLIVNWKHFARRLGVSESDMVDIERSRPTSQDRCYSILQLWREQNGDNATLTTLSHKLRVCRYRQLARDIESIS